MDWKLFWRYALDLAALFPAAFVCLVPVWEFFSRPGRTALAAACFLTLGTLGAAAVCAHFRVDSNLLLLPLAALAFTLYIRALRGTLNVWRAAFPFFTGIFLLAVCGVLSVLLNARAESANEAPVCLPSTSLIALGLAALVCALYALTASGWMRWLLREYEAERIWRAIWLLPAGYTGAYLISMPRHPQILLTGRVQQLSVLTGLLPLGVYFLFLYLFYCIGRESARNLRLTEENHVLTVESHRYEELRAYMEKTRTLRHDFRQHLRVIAGLSEAGRLDELQAYLKSYAVELSDERPVLCANAAVDAIAGYYDAAARREEIPIDWKLELPQRLPMPEAELCMMLGNLLENAVRASAVLPPEERSIRVLLRMLSPGMLGLIVENRYSGVLHRENGKLRSTAHPGSGTIELRSGNGSGTIEDPRTEFPNYDAHVENGTWSVVPRTVTVEWNYAGGGWTARLGNLLLSDEVFASVSADGTLTLTGVDAEKYQIADEDASAPSEEPDDITGILAGLTGQNQTGKLLPFTDVPKSHYAADAIRWAWENGWFSGVSGKRFAPEQGLSRAMLVTVLWRMEGEPRHGISGFTDVLPGGWYEKAVAWAAFSGIVSGTAEGVFSPDAAITREQLAVILWRYAGSPQPSGSLNGFADAAEVSAYAAEAMAWAVEQGIVTGSNGRLLPKSGATRAQTALMLQRFAARQAQ